MVRLLRRALLAVAVLGASAGAQDAATTWTGVLDGALASLPFAVRRGADGAWLLRDADLAALGLAPRGAPVRIDDTAFHTAAAWPDLRIDVRPEFGVVFLRHASVAPTGTDTAWLLATSLNGVAKETVLAASGPVGALRVDADDLRALGVQVAGQGAVDLAHVAGLRYALDPAAQTLALYADPALLGTTRVAARAVAPASAAEGVGGVAFDYELDAQRATGDALRVGGLFELAAFRGGDALETTLASPLGSGRLLRLESTFTRDLPDSGFRLALGDAISGSGTLGGAVRFGGVHFGTERGIQPWAVRSVPVVVRGSAALPSVLDLFIDGRPAGSQPLEPGLFDIGLVPGVSGAGEVRAVARDVLGRVQVIQSTFYADPSLLAPGTSEWSVDAGRLRRDYGYASDRYGDAFAAGSWRRGISARFTAEARLAVTRDDVIGGAAATMTLLDRIVANASLRLDRRRDGTLARAAGITLEHRDDRYAFGLRAERADAEFRDLGDTPVARRSLGAFASVRVGRATLGVDRIERTAADGRNVALWTAHAALPIGRGWLQVLATLADAAAGGNGIGLSYLLPLGRESSAGADVRTGARSTLWTASVQRIAPAGRGYGWRAESGARDGVPFAQGSVDLAGDAYALRIDATRYGDAGALRATLRGSVVRTDGATWFTRWLDGPFAIADAGAPNVDVRLNEQSAARTRADGRALVPGLQPYQRNAISIREDDVPLDREVEHTRIAVVPVARSGVRARFVTPRRLYVLTLTQANGAPVPAGALYDADGVSGAVGLRGATTLGAAPGKPLALHVSWGSAACVASLTPPAGAGTLPGDLGQVRCL